MWLCLLLSIREGKCHITEYHFIRHRQQTVFCLAHDNTLVITSGCTSQPTSSPLIFYHIFCLDLVLISKQQTKVMFFLFVLYVWNKLNCNILDTKKPLSLIDTVFSNRVLQRHLDHRSSRFISLQTI